MARYKYTGDGISFEDANPDYALDLVVGDEFILTKFGKNYQVFFAADTSIPFVVTPKEARALLKESEESLDVTPNPNMPPYLDYAPKFEIIPKFYDYYNKQLFNGGCPKVTFEKTRDNGILGLAVLEWHKGKPVYTMKINEKSMADIRLFTDTVVHEMIHLFLYAKGIKLRDNTITLDSHGPNFQAEMHRINALGFNIDIVAKGETYDKHASETLFAVVVEPANRTFGIQVYWSRTSMINQFDSFVDQFSLAHPSDSSSEIYLLKTNDLRVAQYTAWPSSGKFKPSQLQKWFAQPQGERSMFSGMKQKEIKLTGGGVDIPNYKAMPDTYALGFSRFQNAMRKYGASDTFLRAKWSEFPLRQLNKITETELKSVIGRVARNSITLPDLNNKLQDIVDAYAGRVDSETYKKSILKMLSDHDPHNVMADEYKMLKLT